MSPSDPTAASAAQRTAARRQPLTLICCSHKTGTVLFHSVLNRLGALLDLRWDTVWGEVGAIHPGLHAVLVGHSLFGDGFRLEPHHRIIRIVRDPRDIWVSGYLYHRRCEEPWCVNREPHPGGPIGFPQVDHLMEPRPEAWKEAYLQRLGGRSYQDQLLDRDQESGLAYELDGYTALTFEAMRAWRFAGPQVLTVKLEAITANFDATMSVIFRHMGFSRRARAIALRAAAYEDVGRMPDHVLEQNAHIHSRQLSKWRDVLTAAQLQSFETRYGDLVLGLGYQLATRLPMPRPLRPPPGEGLSSAPAPPPRP